MLGRSLPQLTLAFRHDNVWVPSVLRIVFIPLFILCATPRVFTMDAWPYVFMALFALSNGYLASLAMMYAPTLVADFEQESTGYIMSLCLNSGILLGTHFALLMHSFGIGA